eukprot:SAG25_NODE_9661_length_363_cov_1.132576_1_plen_23_part_01
MSLVGITSEVELVADGTVPYVCR